MFFGLFFYNNFEKRFNILNRKSSKLKRTVRIPEGLTHENIRCQLDERGCLTISGQKVEGVKHGRRRSILIAYKPQRKLTQNGGNEQRQQENGEDTQQVQNGLGVEFSAKHLSRLGVRGIPGEVSGNSDVSEFR